MLDLLALLLSLLSLPLGLLVLLFGLLFGLLHRLQSLQLLLLRLIIVGVEGYAAVADQIRWRLGVLSARIRQPHVSKRRFRIEPPSVDHCEHGDGRRPGENQVDRASPVLCGYSDRIDGPFLALILLGHVLDGLQLRLSQPFAHLAGSRGGIQRRLRLALEMRNHFRGKQFGRPFGRRRRGRRRR